MHSGQIKKKRLKIQKKAKNSIKTGSQIKTNNPNEIWIRALRPKNQKKKDLKKKSPNDFFCKLL